MFKIINIITVLSSFAIGALAGEGIHLINCPSADESYVLVNSPFIILLSFFLLACNKANELIHLYSTALLMAIAA